jgi:hypothetical protein
MPTNAPNGFTPLRHAAGGVIRANEYPIASGLASSIGYGDVVVQTNGGLIDRAAAGDTNIIGVFAGVKWTDTDGTPRFEKRWPTGTATLGAANATAFVYDDPYIVFEAQVTTGTNLTQTMFGNNADITATAADTASGFSRESINISSTAATTAQVRLLGLSQRPDQSLGDASRVECMFQEHLLRTTVGI